jgi:hypothetical protein
LRGSIGCFLFYALAYIRRRSKPKTMLLGVTMNTDPDKGSLAFLLETSK